jgi:hypothetical protein
MSKQKGGARSGWRFLRVLSSPGKTFEEIAAEPAFLKPALVITGICLVLGLILAPKIQAFTLWMIKQNPAAPLPEQMGEALAVAAKAATVGSVVSAAVAPWVVWLVVAGLLKLYDLFAGSGASFKSLFAVAVYGYLPVLIGGLIALPIALSVPVENLQHVNMSLAAFLPAEHSFFYFFLTKCSPFTWWSLFLWGIGGAFAMKTRAANVIAYNFGWWLLYAAVSAALAFWKAPAGMGG